MDNPGVYNLALKSITTALSGEVQSPITGLSGMTALTVEFEFLGGTGGTSCTGVVRTSFDGGITWRDIARADFANTPGTKHCNLEGLLSKGITSYAALATEGVYDGVMGDQLDAVVTSVGTYSNTTFNIRVAVR